jgi:hypothetical protein
VLWASVHTVNQDSRVVRQPGVLSRKVEAVGAGIYLEAAILLRVRDNTLDVEFIVGTLEQRRPVACPKILK